MSTGYLSIAQARERSGLRLLVLRNLPSPWSQVARALFHVKGLEFALVERSADDSADALEDWTGQRSYPAAMYEDERPRSGWADILFLAERLAPEPRLIPEDIGERTRMFGLSNEICGERGFAWERRTRACSIRSSKRAWAESLPCWARSTATRRRRPRRHRARTAQILTELSEQIRSQHARGSRFFLGDTLTALDIYWATFAAMLEPLPEDLCPMDPGLRMGYTLSDPDVRKAADPLLLEHRDFIYREYLELPVQL